MKKLLLVLALIFTSIQASAQIAPPCEEYCEINWEQVFKFPAVAKTYDVSVYQQANEVFVKSVSGVGTIRELVLYMSNGQKRYLVDTYNKLLSPDGTGVVVKLGNYKSIQFIAIRADSWGGSGTEVELMVQLRQRYQPGPY